MTLRRKSLSCERLEVRQVLSASPTGLAELVNDPTIGDQQAHSGNAAATLTDGTMVVADSGRGLGDRDGVYLRLLDADGQPLAEPQLVNQTTAGVQSDAAVSMLPGGGFVVVWQGRGNGDREGIFARWYNAAGSATTGEVLINQTTGGAQTAPQVAVSADGSTTFVWQGVGTGDHDGIFARRFDGAGVPLGNEILVNTTTARQQAHPDIAINDDGIALVTWSSRHQDGSDWGIYAQRFNADGTRLGDEFQVNSHESGSQMAAKVTAVGNDFVVAWQSHDQDGDGWGVYAQTVSAEADLVGNELRLNDQAGGQQHEVSIAATSGGSFVAAWTDGTPDGTGWNVKAREVNLTTQTPTLGDEFFVSASADSPYLGHQRAPNLAATDATFAVAWSGDGAEDHDGVYLQCFAATEVNLSPDLAPIPDQTAQVGVELVIEITATDPNPGDTLTYMLDIEDAPEGATIEKIDNYNAIIRWTPPASAAGTTITFRVHVIDDGEPPLADSEAFEVTVLAE